MSEEDAEQRVKKNKDSKQTNANHPKIRKHSNSDHKKRQQQQPVVVSILGATRPTEEDVEETTETSPPPTSTTPINPSTTTSQQQQQKETKRQSEPVQLLRPPSEFRDASITSVNVLDSRHELSRDLGSLEKSLIGTNTIFRVVGAIGTSLSGRSSTLVAATTTTKVLKEDWFPAKSKGLNIFVHAQRRIILVDFPPLFSSKRNLETPIFASQYSDLNRLYDLRKAFIALSTCTVLFVCVSDEAVDPHHTTDQLVPLIKAASTILTARGWPSAEVVFVRNFVESGNCLNIRRIQADERTLKDMTDNGKGVVHVPKRNIVGDDDELLQADRAIARHALSSFVSKPVRVPLPNRNVVRCTEVEWASSLAYVFNESRSHSFFVAGEEANWLR